MLPFASPVRFETLESRQMMSVTSPVPGDGNDYTFVDDANDAVPAVNASNEQFKRVSLPGGFKWFDGTFGGGLISRTPRAFTTIVDDGYTIWPDNPTGGVIKTGATSEAGTRQLARSAALVSNLVVIDIEEWNFDLRGGDRAAVDSAVARFRQVIGWLRDERPQLKVGVYGYLSISDSGASTELQRFEPIAAAGSPWHINSIPQSSDYYADWQNASDYLKTLAQDVDYVFPSIYNGSTDINNWLDYANSTIRDSRRFGKPVIPFIWPQYHNAVQGVGLQFIPPSMWQAELDLVREQADGAVIWLDSNATFDPNASWVTQTTAKALLDVPVTSAPGASDGDDTGGTSAPGASASASSVGLPSADSTADVFTLTIGRRRIVDQVLGTSHAIA